LTLPAATNGLSSTTSSGSGLEIVSAGLALLQGCSDNQILAWDEDTDVWACAADSTGGTVNSFATINAPNGTDPVADSSTDTLNFADGTGITITGTEGTDTISIAATLGTSIANSELDNDTIDFDKISNTLTLDEATTLTAGSALGLTVGNNVTLSATGTGAITATDLSCTNCIGATEVSDLTLGTDTTGDYVATVTGGAGLTGSGTGEGSTPTLAVGAGSGITVNADDIAL
jgi:hypothetical protein